MRIATYNLWNSTVSWAQRLAAIAEELTVLDADVVAMQEAPTQATDKQSLIDFFRENTPYAYGVHLNYPEEPAEGDRPEGLAFLSKLPNEAVWSSWEDDRATANNWAAKAVVDCCGASLGVTNVHLDWEHRASREQHIAEIVRDVTEKCPCDHDILCGDFNDDVDSLVARFPRRRSFNRREQHPVARSRAHVACRPGRSGPDHREFRRQSLEGRDG